MELLRLHVLLLRTRLPFCFIEVDPARHATPQFWTLLQEVKFVNSIVDKSANDCTVDCLLQLQVSLEIFFPINFLLHPN